MDLVLDVDSSAVSVSAPSGAVTVDGTTLVTTFKNFVAQQKAVEDQFNADSSGTDAGSMFGTDSSSSGDIPSAAASLMIGKSDSSG